MKSIVMPDKLFGWKYQDYSTELANMIRKITGIPIIRLSQIKAQQKFDILISVQAPSIWCQDWSKERCLLDHINRNAFFVYFVDEVHWNDEKQRADIYACMERADLLLTPVKSLVEHWYPAVKNKITFFPWFAHNRFKFDDLNSQCKAKCLAIGGTSEAWYPLRYKMEKEGPHKLGEKLTLIQHAFSKGSGYVFDDFANIVRQHFACFTAPASSRTGILTKWNGDKRYTEKEVQQKFPDIDWTKSVGHLHLKQFEIPCTGSLLICSPEPPEMLEVGFEPWTNFVPINSDNMFDIIKRVLSSPQDYYQIRKNGMNLIHNNHMIEHRTKYLSKLLSQYGISHKRFL